MTDDQTKPRKPSAYLATLPGGWRYEVKIDGPNEQSVEIVPVGWSGEYEIVTTLSDGTGHKAEAESLPAALRQAAKGVKALTAVAEQEAEARKAREAAIAALGSVVEDAGGTRVDDMPEPADPPDQREDAGRGAQRALEG